MFWHGTKRSCLERNILACSIPPVRVIFVTFNFSLISPFLAEFIFQHLNFSAEPAEKSW
jgi:hypothetical protein